MPARMQMPFTRAVSGLVKLEKGIIITVAAMTIPIMPWKARE